MATSPYGHPMGQQQPDGTWSRTLDGRFAVKLPISFDTPDGTALLTVSQPVLVERVLWQVETAFVGAGAFGVSGRNPPEPEPETPPPEEPPAEEPPPEEPPAEEPPPEEPAEPDPLPATIDDPGNLLGSADAAELVVGVLPGTPGGLFDEELVLLKPGAKIVLDVITAGFTAGAGFVHVIGTALG